VKFDRDDATDILKTLCMVIGVVVLVVIAFSLKGGKTNAEQERDNAVDSNISLADQVKNACAKGGVTAKSLGSACVDAQQIVSNPETVKGDRGDRGPRGLSGPAGPQGSPGPSPSMGDISRAVVRYLATNPPSPGPAGRDGRDGKDGVDGKDGSAGKDGSDGAPGKDGMDGSPGPTGAPGPTCPEGYIPNQMMILTPEGPKEAVVCTTPQGE
jgi:hypothetical protein